MTRLAVICARGGSKGIQNKNLRKISGEPLVSITIRQAYESGAFDWIAVSSDNQRILETGTDAGADFTIKRPKKLATDLAAKVPAIRHCAEKVEKYVSKTIDLIVDLDVTSPLRSVEDIRGAIKKLEKSNADNLVTGTAARRSPYFNLVEIDSEKRVHLCKKTSTLVFRRQDAPICFDLNASVFCWKRASLFSTNDSVIGNNTIFFEMPAERSIDIDTELDFAIVQLMMEQKLGK